MSCFNFIIMKVNGADVSNLPYEEAVQLFLNAQEPILVEVRRRCFDDRNKLSFFNYDTHKSPTLAVIASSNTPDIYDGIEFCRHTEDASCTLGRVKYSSEQIPSISSTSCQTELSAFDSESKEILFMKDDNELDSGTFFRRKQEETSTNIDVADGCLRTEFDIEEITLRKSQSTENLGFTISYSTEDFSGSDSGSDICLDDCREVDRRDDEEYNLNDYSAHKCKIYVSDIVPNSLADRDGRLRQGDRILQINGQNVLEKMDPNKLLTEHRYSVTILVSRNAYVGEDDFLDSAVYCDDKECQDDRYQSSNCECEQNTFSSKSSISQSEQKSCTPTTVTNIYPILPIAVEKVSDLFNHANIKAQLESVNKEISLLNSQISIMKLQQLKSEHRPPMEKQQSSPLKTKEKPCAGSGTTLKVLKAQEKLSSRTKPEMEIEHIYETIPEDTESDAYYCSPYEGVNELRVEQWLKSIGCTRTQAQSGDEKSKSDAHVPHPLAPRLQKHNPSLDDYDNSSSAYNTGGSCNSALLAFDQQSKPTSSAYPAERHSSKKFSLKCKNVFHAFDKSTHPESRNSEIDVYSIKQLHSTCRDSNISISEKSQLSSCLNRRTPVPSTSVPTSSHCPTDVDSDGHSTLVAKSRVYRMCQYKATEHYKEEDLSEMVWKVKRRPDGTRYIVRRVTKKCPTTEKSPVDTQSQIQLQESASAIDYKRQVLKLKERRHRHRNQGTPSKEKHHAQHWLV